MDVSIKYLMSLEEDELLELLVPPSERHSPDSDIPRGKYILNQCISRSKDSIVSFYNEHRNAIAFTEELVAALVPVISKSVPATIVVVIAVIVLKHGIEKYI